MAARWGTGEEMLKACNTQFFSPVNLDEVEMLQGGFPSSCLDYSAINSVDALEALHVSLDPSILSIFEDSAIGGVKVNMDEESEVTLLTALTEILDNVDDENLSPFDSLPDSDLISGHKGQDHSPIRKMFSLSPAESVTHTRPFPGKDLPRMQKISFQNSEGEEEDNVDASFLTPIANIDLSLDELDWCLPVSLEQDGENLSLTLSDLVKQMHPYCMTLCMEGEEGQEHLLPEGGLVLEVVDQGEHGEPILAIPDLGIPNSFTKSTEIKQMVPDKTINKTDSKDEGEKCKHSSKEKLLLKGNENIKNTRVPLIEQRVLKSSNLKVEPHPKKQKEIKKKVTFSPLVSSAVPTIPKQEPQKQQMTLKAETLISSQAEENISDLQPESKPLEMSLEDEAPLIEEPVGTPIICYPTETKPKPLSLQQYRLLRQQKKPEPANKIEDNSTKWPKLPEAPKELTPIPCLPTDSTSRDPRKTSYMPFKKDAVPEIMPAWHPRGPAAPPTPEALLVPPASLIASKRKSASSVLTPREKASQSVQSPLPEKPAAVNAHQNANHTETTAPIKKATEVPSKVVLSLHMPTTSGASPSIIAASHDNECLQKSPHTALSNKVPSKSQVASTPIQSFAKSITAMPVKKETQLIELAPVCNEAKNVSPALSKKPTSPSQPHVAPIAAQPFFTAQVQARVVQLAEQMRKASSQGHKNKSATFELIESFTSEIGIEAADLTSLLEQFEDSQTKEEPRASEVCGRAAAVGNSSFEEQVETKAPERTQNHDLGSTAGLTPPATPPHQMWKPIAPISLLGKNKKAEAVKPTPSTLIQIEPRPLTSNKQRRLPLTTPTLGQMQPFSLDHDYCLPSKEPCQADVGSRWNVKQQPSIVIKTKDLALTKPLQNCVSKFSSDPTVTETTHKLCLLSADTSGSLKGSALVTPDTSPSRTDHESCLLKEEKLSHQTSPGYPEHLSRPYQQSRGRSKRRYRTQYSSSSYSSSESSSRSRSPPRKRYRSRHSSSRSSSSSQSRSRSRSFSPRRRRRFSYSSSCSGSWSRSRSRSRSTSSSESRGHRSWKNHRSPNQRPGYQFQNNSDETKRRKEKAIEERRVVYVGRICGNMTRKELKERFLYFGAIEECTVHFRENGDNYGFVTYYSVKDAFNAIENGSQLRKPNEFPFDLCFGGRRQFCKTSYADLDSNRERDPKTTKGKFDALDFDTLLKQAQRNLQR